MDPRNFLGTSDCRAVSISRTLGTSLAVKSVNVSFASLTIWYTTSWTFTSKPMSM